MPLWESAIRPQLISRGIDVSEIEVEDNKLRLEELGVTLGKGVPRIVYYTASGEGVVHTGERTARAILHGADTHITSLSAGASDVPSVSPSFVTENLPATVLYFKEKCSFCTRFYPEFSSFAHSPNVGTVVRVDMKLHPQALRTLHPSATSPGVPHVVFHRQDGTQIPYGGERTASALRKFLKQLQSTDRHVSFEGGSTMPVHGSAEARLTHALDKLQERASTTLGNSYRRTFEPDKSTVTFVGIQSHTNANADRVYILLSPLRKPRGKPPAHACIYGSRSGEFTTKIYVNKDIEVLLRNKRHAGFVPVTDADPYVSALKTFGYHVELA